ncbi:hypothetical protein A6P54_02550 [Bacillus sp. MKU004]|nr:hypothetical protein A6P54_02550 [Bacillus sp. MKU004]
MSELTVWNSNNGAPLPSKITSVKDLVPYNQRLFPKELHQITKAFDNELYDMSVEYTWRRTFNIIKEKVLSFGIEFVMEMLGRSSDDDIDSISEIELIRLAADLGIINETAKLRFLHIIDLITHYSSRNVQEEEIDHLDALKNIQLCMKYVLAIEEDGFQISYNNFRDQLKLEEIEEDMLETLQISPYFYKKTTIRTLLNLIKTTKGAEQETVYSNMLSIVPVIWPELLSDDRYPMGLSYAEAVNEGDLELVKALKGVLLKVQGFDYVPEDLRSRSFIEAAKKLLELHFGFDNFYREPAGAKTLLSMGKSIPKPALGACISSVMACLIGNGYGRSKDAQPYLKKILENLTKERWEYYFNNVFKADETILMKLAYPKGSIINNWNEIVSEYELSELEIKNTLVRRLIDSTDQGNMSKVEENAKKIYSRLRGL